MKRFQTASRPTSSTNPVANKEDGETKGKEKEGRPGIYFEDIATEDQGAL